MRKLAAAALAACAMGAVGCGGGDGAPGGKPGLETAVSVYFLREAPCEVHPVPRVVTAASALERARATLELLLQGPSPEELEDGFRTAIPDSMRAWRHWQGHVAFGYDPPHEGQSVRIREVRQQAHRLLWVDFSGELEAVARGPDGACAVVRQIQSTVAQFDEYDGAVIAVEGRTQGILQP